MVSKEISSPLNPTTTIIPSLENTNNMNEQKTLVLFGPTGQGKSSIANMLIQGDIYQEKNAFVINDSAVGASVQIECSVNDEFEVYDTIGIGETRFGSVPHKKAVKKIRDYFSRCKVPLNYIAYVKKKGRFTDEDREMFGVFKEIFKGGEKNFIIIITDSEPEWVKENSKTIKKNFGNYPIISVDFPQRYKDEAVTKRAESLQRLKTNLSSLGYNGIKLEILSSTHKFENKISKIVSFVPFFGTAYQMISSCVYYAVGRPITATERLIEGTTGLVFGGISLKGIFLFFKLCQNINTDRTLRSFNFIYEKFNYKFI